MKTVWISVFLLLFGCASWSRTDMILEGSFMATMAVDAAQTMNAGPGLETNPVMGTSPNVTTSVIYFVTATAFHAGIAALLPGKWRNAWQGVWIGAETIQIWKNGVLPHPDPNRKTIVPTEYR